MFHEDQRVDGKPVFGSFNDALSFIVQCVDRHDHGMLVDSCHGKLPSIIHSSRWHAVGRLAAFHAKKSLKRRFRGISFPTDGDVFILGGEAGGLPGIMFLKVNDGWIIYRISSIR